MKFKRLPIRNPIEAVLVAAKTLGHDIDDYRPVFCQWQGHPVFVSQCRSCVFYKGSGEKVVLCREPLLSTAERRLELTYAGREVIMEGDSYESIRD